MVEFGFVVVLVKYLTDVGSQIRNDPMSFTSDIPHQTLSFTEYWPVSTVMN